MPKVSVIIAVYNVEEFIDDCLKSIVTQTVGDYEVLIVNDGSPDNSQKIIDRYAKKYKFVHSFQKENGGLSDARNFGIKKAKAPCVYFIDADDFVAPDLMEKIIKKIDEEKPDLIYFDFVEFYHWNKTKVMSGIKNVKGSSLEKYMVSPPAAWNKVFKKSFFTDYNIWFPKGIWYEDLATTLRILLHAKTISYIDTPLYYYRQREGSIMSSVNPRIFEMYQVLDILENYYKEQNKSQEFHDVLEILTILNLVFINRVLASSNMDDKYLRQCEAINYVNNNYPNWKNNRFYHQEKVQTRLHMRVLYSKQLLKIYNKIRSF